MLRSSKARVLPGIGVVAGVILLFVVLRSRQDQPAGFESPTSSKPIPEKKTAYPPVIASTTKNDVEPHAEEIPCREKRVEITVNPVSAPPQTVRQNSRQLRDWVLNLSAKELSQMTKTDQLDQYVWQVVQNLESEMEDPATGSSEAHAFLAQLNERIRQNRR